MHREEGRGLQIWCWEGSHEKHMWAVTVTQCIERHRRYVQYFQLGQQKFAHFLSHRSRIKKTDCNKAELEEANITGHKKVKLRPTMCHDGTKRYYFFNLCARCRWAINARSQLLYLLEWPSIHFVDGWVGPRAGLDGREKCHPFWDSISRMSSPGKLLYWLHYPDPYKRMCVTSTKASSLYYILRTEAVGSSANWQ